MYIYFRSVHRPPPRTLIFRHSSRLSQESCGILSRPQNWFQCSSSSSASWTMPTRHRSGYSALTCGDCDSEDDDDELLHTVENIDLEGVHDEHSSGSSTRRSARICARGFHISSKHDFKARSCDTYGRWTTRHDDYADSAPMRAVPRITAVVFLLSCRVHAMVQESVCLLYTSPSPRDGLLSRMPSSA